MRNLKPYIPWILVILAVIYLWWDYRHPKVQYEKEFVEVETPKYLERTKYVQLECVNAVAYDKSDASKRLDVPDSIKTDEAKQITAAGEIGPYRGTTTVTAVFDTGTGRTSLLSRREPLPFFALMNDKEIGMRYGASRYDVFGRWTFIRVGAVHLAGYAEMNTRPEGVLSIEGSYRW
jgi:hypothetical protein